MTIIKRPSEKVNPKQARTPLPFCNTHHKPNKLLSIQRYGDTEREAILKKLPNFCRATYDALKELDQGDGVITITRRELSDITTYSKSVTGRALFRLRHNGLITPLGRSQWYLEGSEDEFLRDQQ